jgi:hypothetical protein
VLAAGHGRPEGARINADLVAVEFDVRPTAIEGRLVAVDATEGEVVPFGAVSL